jgi:hypothetical protein
MFLREESMMRHVLIISGVLLSLSLGASSRTITVALDGSGEFSTIQAAIDAAGDGETVMLADGIYTGAGNRDIGFKGKAITVRGAGGAEHCIIDCEGAGRGFFFHRVGTDSVIDGLTIRNGHVGDYNAYGGGVWCYSGAAPTIMNCRILDCRAEGWFDGDDECFDGAGGGICGSRGPIINCIVEGNRADGPCGNYGGGLYDCDGPIIDCIIRDNWADSGGGLYDCDGPIINCVIVHNWTGSTWFWTYKGGGLSECDGPIINCTIANNMLVAGSDRRNDNLWRCDGSIRNCIVWGEASGGASIIDCRARVEYSDVMGGYGGVGNMDVAPLFVDVANGDYHLKSAAGRWDPVAQTWVYDPNTSPCVDAGEPEGYWYDAEPDPNGINDPSDDVWVGGPTGNWQGELWPHGGRINMGAYGGTREASMSLNPVGNVADLDYDEAVGGGDFGVMAWEWGNGAAGGGQAAGWAATQGRPYVGDLDRDGVVGLGDLVMLAEDWASD